MQDASSLLNLSLFSQYSQAPSNEVLKHVLAKSGLVPWHGVTGIPHCEEPQVVNGLEVSDGFSIAELAAPWLVLGLIVAASTRPGGHLVKHGKNTWVVADAEGKIYYFLSELRSLKLC